MRSIIKITKNQESGTPQVMDISTSSFILLYLEGEGGGEVKVIGGIELRDIAPIIMKHMAEKMSK